MGTHSLPITFGRLHSCGIADWLPWRLDDPQSWGRVLPAPCRIGWPSLLHQGAEALPSAAVPSSTPVPVGGQYVAVVHVFCARLHFGNVVTAHVKL